MPPNGTGDQNWSAVSNSGLFLEPCYACKCVPKAISDSADVLDVGRADTSYI